MHGHERPRAKGVSSGASLQQSKPRPVQPAQERQKSNETNVASEGVVGVVADNATTQGAYSLSSQVSVCVHLGHSSALHVDVSPWLPRSHKLTTLDSGNPLATPHLHVL